MALYSSTFTTLGGLWEAEMSSMKYHLNELAGIRAFTFKELDSVEACLNSCPMIQMTSSKFVQEIS
jgi:hypothetical protein